jgi:hypothetical protein
LQELPHSLIKKSERDVFSGFFFKSGESVRKGCRFAGILQITYEITYVPFKR